MEEKLFEVLKQLSLRIKKTIEDGISKSTFQPECQSFAS